MSMKRETASLRLTDLPGDGVMATVIHRGRRGSINVVRPVTTTSRGAALQTDLTELVERAGKRLRFPTEVNTSQ